MDRFAVVVFYSTLVSVYICKGAVVPNTINNNPTNNSLVTEGPDTTRRPLLVHRNLIKDDKPPSPILEERTPDPTPNQLPKLTHGRYFPFETKNSDHIQDQQSEENLNNPWHDYDGDRPLRHRIDATSDIKLEYCKRPAKCQKLNFTSCMGTKLTYSTSTLELTDLSSQEQVQETLLVYQHLRHVPKCWAVIQPFLCSLYMPKCENDMVDLPSIDMCNITRGPCRILYHTHFFPSLLRCENDRRMPLPAVCKNDIKEIKFNTSGQCLKPLIQTDSPPSFYKGVDGCGLQCNNPLYTEEEHEQTHQLVAWGATICLLFNIFTICTFMIDWKTANRYPGVEIFYINVCFLFSCFGWLAQFNGNLREEIVCRKDGTLRASEPSAGENLWCVIVFVLVYYFLIAGLVWFVIFTYAWHLSVTVQALGKIPERIDKKGAYFHLASWSLPLVLTITTMALGEIDGDSVSGICFVGYIGTPARVILMLIPVCVALIIGYYFLFRGLLTLIRLELGSRDVISARASSEIRSTVIRVGIIYIATLFLGVTTIGYHVYQITNAESWRTSLHNLIICRVTYASNAEFCQLEHRPNIRWLKFQLLSVFAAGIGMSSLVWTRPTIKTWVRFIRKKFDCEKEEPVRLQKHKVIAQAFAKRKMFYNAGRVSLSFHNTHTDPVGLDFDLNSVASHDLSSTWAAALPKLMNRRCALTGAPTGSVSSQRRNSIDSEVSFSVRRVSVESRRNSVDSQLSVQVAELKATRKVVGSSARRHRSRRRHRRPSRAAAGPLFSRRESSTSLESQLGTHLLNALVHPDMQSLVPNLKRRSANAGLDTQQITNLLSSGKLVLPAAMVASGSECEDETKSENPRDRNAEVLSDSSQTSECAELTRLAVQSSLNSGVSVGTQHNGCKSVDVAVQADARDIATQTLSSYELEMVELTKSIDEIQNTRARSRCVSQGTQMSPVVDRRTDVQKSPAPVKPKRTSIGSNKRISPVCKNTSSYLMDGLCNDRRYNRRSLRSDYEMEPLNSRCMTANDENEESSLLNGSMRPIKIIKTHTSD